MTRVKLNSILIVNCSLEMKVGVTGVGPAPPSDTHNFLATFRERLYSDRAAKRRGSTTVPAALSDGGSQTKFGRRYLIMEQRVHLVENA